MTSLSHPVVSYLDSLLAAALIACDDCARTVLAGFHAAPEHAHKEEKKGQANANRDITVPPISIL